MISNFRESDTKWIPEFPVCGCSCSPSLKKLSNWLPPACVGRAQRGLRTFLWTNVAANAGACAGSSGSGMWWLCRGGVLRYCGHWVGDMSNGDLWSLGTRKWAPMWGQATMLWSECWEPGERGISDQMWAGALFSIESWSLMCCVLLVISWRSDQWWRRDGTGHNELIVLGCINGSYHRHLLTVMLVMWPSHRMLLLLLFLKSVFVAKISLGNTSGVISRSHWLAVTADTGLTSSGDKTSYFVLGRGLMNCNNVLEAQ